MGIVGLVRVLRVVMPSLVVMVVINVGYPYVVVVLYVVVLIRHLKVVNMMDLLLKWTMSLRTLTSYVYSICMCMQCTIVGTIDDSEISTEILGVIIDVASF